MRAIVLRSWRQWHETNEFSIKKLSCWVFLRYKCVSHPVRVKKEGVRLICYIKEPSLNNRVHTHLLCSNARQLGQPLRTLSNSSCVPIKNLVIFQVPILVFLLIKVSYAKWQSSAWVLLPTHLASLNTTPPHKPHWVFHLHRPLCSSFSSINIQYGIPVLSVSSSFVCHPGMIQRRKGDLNMWTWWS